MNIVKKIFFISSLLIFTINPMYGPLEVHKKRDPNYIRKIEKQCETHLEKAHIALCVVEIMVLAFLINGMAYYTHNMIQR